MRLKRSSKKPVRRSVMSPTHCLKAHTHLIEVSFRSLKHKQTVIGNAGAKRKPSSERQCEIKWS
jgi:hypothetical protein